MSGPSCVPGTALACDLGAVGTLTHGSHGTKISREGALLRDLGAAGTLTHGSHGTKISNPRRLGAVG